MIECKYCGSQIDEKQANCPFCYTEINWLDHILTKALSGEFLMKNLIKSVKNHNTFAPHLKSKIKMKILKGI